MKIKTSQNLVLEALKDIKTISAEEGLKLFNNKECNLIDIRDEVELQKNGRIENSYHISRGLLEFSIHPDSAYFKNKEIDISKEMVLFCAAGGRSALAVKTLKEMGFEKVSHIEGGFGSMQNSGFKVKK
jgi:Rhodanese-related sulfurtransferase|tara:strand:+ start:466 stop:852 length:387 start_codon:yes stop_codon:yes gene_type:complete